VPDPAGHALRTWTGWHALARWRRSLGVATFVYGTLHWLAYAWLDQGLDWPALVHDVAKRPSSWWAPPPGWPCCPGGHLLQCRHPRPGRRRWQDLHKTVYGIALAALLHFFWVKAGKNDFAEVAVYGMVILGLLAWRWQRWRIGDDHP
jgi:sulfoxide reductase heme-binding subunit YedZ